MTRVRRWMIGSILVALTATTVDVRAQSGTTPGNADTLFADAVAKETAVRKVLTARTPADTVLKAVRTVVADYENLVRRFPSSAFCDDALWRAAKLLGDGFALFHDPQDQSASLRLFQKLSVQYPTSMFAKQAPGQVAAISRLPSGAPVKTEGAATTTPAGGDSRSSGSSADLAVRPPPPGPKVRATTESAATKAAPAKAAPAPRAPAPPKIATIKAIRRTVLNDVVRIVIELDAEVHFRDERLDAPPRVFVDLPSTRADGSLKDQTLRFESDADLVRQVRIGRHPNDMTRIVLDVAGVSSYSVYPLYSPYRLIIDCLRATPAAGMAPTPPFPAPKPPPILSGRRFEIPSLTAPPSLRARAAEFRLSMPPGLAPRASAALAEAAVQATPPSPPTLPASPIGVNAATAPLPASPVDAKSAATATLPEASPSRNIDGGYSIARQLGLGVSRIVIDPGHGGHDPGTKGGGATEAELVLDISLRVEKLLAKVEGVEVVLTRRDDEYVSLQERTAIANRENADLFLSIHANASNSAQVQGVETYFLNFATNLGAAAVAARENAASGQSMGELPDVVKTIALNNKIDESRDFATFVQKEMMEKLRPANKGLRDLGVKQAPFVVLIGAAMPSVLAEVSFMTNAQEARLLKTPAYRQRIAEALFDAIREYQGSLKKTTSVAQQSQQ